MTDQPTPRAPEHKVWVDVPDDASPYSTGWVAAGGHHYVYIGNNGGTCACGAVISWYGRTISVEMALGEHISAATAPSEGSVTLWHPDSPGMRVTVRPCLLRRLGLIRSEFATLSEVLRMYRDREASR